MRVGIVMSLIAANSTRSTVVHIRYRDLIYFENSDHRALPGLESGWHDQRTDICVVVQLE